VFLGQYEYTLDDKGRLTIPVRFREELGDEVIVTRSLDRCLVIYPLEVWEALSQKITELSITDPQGRALRRLFFADAVKAMPDRQGRVIVPDRLRLYAGLELGATVIVVGLDRYIEVWEPQRWEEYNARQLQALEMDPASWEKLKI